MYVPFKKLSKSLEAYPSKIEMNGFTNKLEINRRAFSDLDLNDISIWLDYRSLPVAKDRISQFLESSSTKKYHPFQEVIEKYKGKKPEGLIRSYANRIITDFGMIEERDFYPDLWPLVFQKWFVGMYAAQQKGNKQPNELFLLIVGSQGVGKTQFVRDILPDSLSRYLTNITIGGLVSKDRDILNAISTNCIAFDDEFGHYDTATSESFKTLLSNINSEVDQKYQRNLDTITRRASFIGTSNTAEHLKDVTGNRRLVIIKAESITWIDPDKATKKELQEDQKTKELMWLEAKNLYDSGYDWKLSKKEFEIINSQMLDNQEWKPEYDIVQFLCEPSKEGETYAIVTSSEVLNIVINEANFKCYPGNVSRALELFGIKNGKYMVKKGKRRRGYRLSTSSLILEKLLFLDGFSYDFFGNDKQT